MNLVYRLAYIPTEGSDGITHAFALQLQPYARSRAISRRVRLSLGAEVAFRDAPNHHNDGIVWFVLGVGAQWPGRVATPYLSAVAYGGAAIRQRFDRVLVDYAFTLGPEVGVDLRAAGFAGLGLALGGGWTQIGGQWSAGAWAKASLAFW